MNVIQIRTKNTPAVIANLHGYGRKVQARARKAVSASLDRTYDMAQSLCAVRTGATKAKMRKVLASDGLSYQMGFYESDFPDGFVPWFLEFGTKRQASHPCILPTAKAEEPKLRRDLAEAVKP